MRDEHVGLPATGRGPWELVHAEEFERRAEAMARERPLQSGQAKP